MNDVRKIPQRFRIGNCAQTKKRFQETSIGFFDSALKEICLRRI
jgi:hypothetical protein